VRGCQHKYTDTALLLVNEVCGAYCRYCFRKRLFMNDNDDATLNYKPGLRYIAEHEEITNLLLTGGDPLIMSTRRLEPIISDAAAIPHVRIIRIGSKMVAFNPYRVLDDPDLLRLIREHCNAKTQIYIMNHFDHPRELTPEAREAVSRLRQAGAQTVNQCPIVRGVNDRPQTFAGLFRELSFMGCPQYYVFQGRPTAGNEPYEVPILEGLHIVMEANRHLSGLAKRARFAMSHRTGKIEILGADPGAQEGRLRADHRGEAGRSGVLARPANGDLGSRVGGAVGGPLCAVRLAGRCRGAATGSRGALAETVARWRVVRLSHRPRFAAADGVSASGVVGAGSSGPRSVRNRGRHSPAPAHRWPRLPAPAR
jgi:KamA family protein